MREPVILKVDGKSAIVITKIVGRYGKKWLDISHTLSRPKDWKVKVWVKRIK